MAEIITIANQKGGVAKTTTVFNLSAVLASMGKKTLMIDLDSQASLTISAGLEPLTLKYTICDMLAKKGVPASDCIVKLEQIENLHIIPSIIDLAVMEMEIISRSAREGILSRALKQIEDNYDYILIDCPPHLLALTINGLAAADKIIVPVKTDYLAFRGLTQLNDSIQDVKEFINNRVEVVGIIATLYEKIINEDRIILSELKSNYEVIGVIKKAADAKKGVYEGLPIVRQFPKSEVAQEYVRIANMIASNNYKRLVK